MKIFISLYSTWRFDFMYLSCVVDPHWFQCGSSILGQCGSGWPKVIGFVKGDFLEFFYVLFNTASSVCPSDSTIMRFWHWQPNALTTVLGLIHTRLDLIHKIIRFYSWKIKFFDQKLQIICTRSLKIVQATVEAFSPQKRTSITLKTWNFLTFLYFHGSFCPLGSVLGSSRQMQIRIHHYLLQI